MEQKLHNKRTNNFKVSMHSELIIYYFKLNNSFLTSNQFIENSRLGYTRF